MNNEAASETAAPTDVPSLVGLWTLKIDAPDSPKLDTLNGMDITFQVPGLVDSPLYGSVNTDGPYSSYYAMINAAFDGGVDISFEVTISGTTFQFNGVVEKGIHMSGSITGTSDPESKVAEEGSWSAQAQGGGDPL